VVLLLSYARNWLKKPDMTLPCIPHSFNDNSYSK